jgi:hypothetical protein
MSRQLSTGPLAQQAYGERATGHRQLAARLEASEHLHHLDIE